MNRVVGMLSMLIRENLIAGDLKRRPEEFVVMTAADQVTAWHEQGADDGSIAPIYHLNALACSRLARSGGTVVDLGCGSGRYAAYLARCRPDLKIVGLDLSEPMVATGNAALRAAGIGDRVELRIGDMTSFEAQAPDDTVLVTSVFAIHQLPALAQVEQCFRELAAARARFGCAVWIFDLVRPTHGKTAVAYPEVFTPKAPVAFKADSTNSLIAAYSYEELERAIRAYLPVESVRGQRSRLLPLYQAFWLEGMGGGGSALGLSPIALEQRLSAGGRVRYQLLRRILPDVPR